MPSIPMPVPSAPSPAIPFQTNHSISSPIPASNRDSMAGCGSIGQRDRRPLHSRPITPIAGNIPSISLSTPPTDDKPSSGAAFKKSNSQTISPNASTGTTTSKTGKPATGNNIYNSSSSISPTHSPIAAEMPNCDTSSAVVKNHPSPSAMPNTSSSKKNDGLAPSKENGHTLA